MRHVAAVLILILIAGCVSHARQPFDVHEGAIRYTNLAGGRHRVAGADVKTFQHVGGIYGQDNIRVYHADTVVEGADPTSFQYIGGDAGRDAKAAYVAGTRCPDCDAASFRHIDRNWYADKNFVYEGTRRRPDIDKTTFQPFNYWFVKDQSNVFLSGRPIPGADASSFKLASCGACEVCGEDKNRCYWFENAVACDCAPHHGGEFAFPPPERSRRQALLNTTGPISIDLNRLTSAFHGLSVGYWRIDPGRHALPLNCWNKNRSEPVQLTLDIEPARIYRLSQRKGATCEIEVERTALVQGRADGPEIQIRLMNNEEDRSRSTLPEATRKQLSTKPRSKVELAAGVYTLTAVCRNVTRTGVHENSTDITVTLEPWRIYKLEATFEAPEYKCNARVAIVED
jgi:hypothetical protein